MINRFIGRFRFLSNFYGGPNSVEIKYQAAKTTNRDDIVRIYKSGSPGPAKITATHTIALRPDWEERKVEIMWRLVWEKFFFDKELQQKLLATGIEELVEGNTWHDNFWGSCTCNHCRGTYQCIGRKAIEGCNMLGKILMDVRRRFQD